MITRICLLSLIGALSQFLAAQKPNILFIVSEDNGPELGCYGDPNAQVNNMTPTLDQLAREGILFNRAFVPYSVCSPSRACFYTGTHVAQNGHEGLQTHKFQMYEAFPSYLKLLQEGGYRTGLIGKLHINPGSAVTPFAEYRSITGSNFGQNSRDMYNYATKALEFITGGWNNEADINKPYVLTINYPDAHLPMWHSAPNSDPAGPATLPANPITWEDVQTIPWVGVSNQRLRDETAGYYNCLRRLDDGIKMVLDGIVDATRDGEGVPDPNHPLSLENTLIIYMGDHGAQFSRGKTSVYEAGLRVPLIVKWPGNTTDLEDEFNHRQELVSTIDIMPTMLQAAGVTVPSHCSGFPLQPLLKNQSTPWRKHIFAHTTGSSANLHYTQLSARGDRYKLIYNPLKDPSMPENLRTLHNRSAQAYMDGGGHFEAGCRPNDIYNNPVEDTPEETRTPDHVRAAYDLYLNPPLYELYDLENDPEEFYNLAENPAYAAVKQELIGALEAWQTDPIIADPWNNLENVQNFGQMMEDARSLNYRNTSGWIWDYIDADWNYIDWRNETYPTYTAPQPNSIYAINFENAEGFTFPNTGSFALFPAGTLTDTSGGVWQGDGSDSGIWNRDDIPPEGLQALRIGADDGTSQATLTLPANITEFGVLRFAYANYSGSTNATGKVSIREFGTSDWTEVWTQDFNGLQVDWKVKPWPFAEIPVNLDGRYEILFHSSGERGFKVDQLTISEKVAASTPVTYQSWRTASFPPENASDDLISGEDEDPDNDGISNKMEFIIGTNPEAPNDWCSEFVISSKGYADLQIQRNLPSEEDWYIEYSTDMENWTPFNRRRLIDQDEQGIQKWEVNIPPMNDAKLFFRIRAN